MRKMRLPQTSIFNFYAVPNLEPSVLLPPQPLPGGAAPHWGSELSDITPMALARPCSLPPHRRTPLARPSPRIGQASICCYLCLLGRQDLECPSCIYFGSTPPPLFFWTEREHRSVFLGKRQDTKNPGRGCSHQPWWIRLYVSQYPGDSGQVAPVKPTQHTPGLSLTLAEETGPGAAACRPGSVFLSWVTSTEPLLHLRFGTQANQD